MTLLAIETATRICGAAFLHDGTVLAEKEVDEKNVHAERLMGLIEDVLRDHGGLKAVDAIAVSIGPGSFTGLRIGVSVAKGLAYGGDKIIVGVPTLGALIERARRGSAIIRPSDTLVGLLQARKGEFFVAREGADEVRVVRGETIVAEGSAGNIVLTGDVESLGLSSNLPIVEKSLRSCSAATLGLIGERMIRAGKRDNIETLEPHYMLEFFLNVHTMERN